MENLIRKIATRYILPPGVYEIYMGSQFIRSNPKFRMSNPKIDVDLKLPKLKPIVFNYLRQKGFIKGLMPDKLEIVPIMGRDQKKDIKQVDRLNDAKSPQDRIISDKIVEEQTKGAEGNDITMEGFIVRVKSYPGFGITFVKKN